jgi:hypothetical protein
VEAGVVGVVATGMSSPPQPPRIAMVAASAVSLKVFMDSLLLW